MGECSASISSNQLNNFMSQESHRHDSFWAKRKNLAKAVWVSGVGLIAAGAFIGPPGLIVAGLLIGSAAAAIEGDANKQLKINHSN